MEKNVPGHDRASKNGKNEFPSTTPILPDIIVILTAIVLNIR